MDFKKMWKRFFTLDRHHAEGFTLVELIVVIAILAILGGVAVPAYSGYVEKANIGADQTLVSEVAHALTLYYYSHPETTGGYVVLKQEGKEATGDDVGKAAMQAVFGDDWATAVGLKHDSWTGEQSAASYVSTSYYGHENSLLNEVDRLTNALGGAVKDYNLSLGDKFPEFLNGYGLSSSSGANEIGNAAVLYVAQQTVGNEQFIKDTFASNLSSGNFINDTFNALSPKIGDAAALAAIYAYAEGFAQYCDAQDGSATNAVNVFHENAKFENITDAYAALKDIETAFNALEAEGRGYVPSYMAQDGPGMANVGGYVGIMGTVNNNKDVVDGNLAAEDCFTDGTVENLLKGYAAMGSMGVNTNNGEVAVILTFDKNGVPMVYTSDMGINKQ